jgi:hypothetical protein
MQGATAIWVNADSVAVQAVSTHCIALEHLHIDACAD